MASPAQLNVLNDAIFVLALLGRQDLSEQLEEAWEQEFAASSPALAAA
jgi:hypothetical protein